MVGVAAVGKQSRVMAFNATSATYGTITNVLGRTNQLSTFLTLNLVKTAPYTGYVLLVTGAQKTCPTSHYAGK